MSRLLDLALAHRDAVASGGRVRELLDQIQTEYDRQRGVTIMGTYPIYRCPNGHSTQSSSPLSSCPTCGKPVSK